MRFKEWLLSEMAYFRTVGPTISYDDKIVYAIDMRFEDREETKHLNQGSSFFINLEKASIDDEKFHTRYPYLICDGNFTAKGVYLDDIDLDKYEEIPSDWLIYAEFYDQEYEVIKPALKDAYSRLT